MTILKSSIRKLASHAPAFALAGVLAAAGSAHATSLSFTGFAHGYQIAAISNASPATGGVYGAGELQFSMVDNGVTSTLNAYCVDIFQSASALPQEYTLVNGVTHFGAERANDLGRLFTLFDSLNTDNSVSALETGAMQLAIWEIVNEVATAGGNLAFDLASGGFTATSSATVLAQSLLDGLSTVTSSYNVSVYESASYQDYLVLNKVPEPGSLALMFGALGALGFTARKRQAAAAAA